MEPRNFLFPSAFFTVNPNLPETHSNIIVRECTHRRVDSIHYHPYCQIWYTIDGTYLHNSNGETYILPRGSIIIVPPFARHYINTITTKNKSLASLSFFINDFHEHYRDTYKTPVVATYDSFLFNSKSLPLVYRFPNELQPYISSVFLEACKLSKNNTKDKRLLDLLREILSMIPPEKDFSSDTSRLSKLHDNTNTITEMAIQLNEIASSESPRMDDLAERALMSKRLLQTNFSNITQTTVSDFLQSSRTLLACRRLASTNISVNNVAWLSGFYDPSHLRKNFTPRLLCSPNEYRHFARLWDSLYDPYSINNAL